MSPILEKEEEEEEEEEDCLSSPGFEVWVRLIKGGGLGSVMVCCTNFSVFVERYNKKRPDALHSFLTILPL
jgi:hypothetical protein